MNTQDEELQFAWAAGFFDGEGCVAICRQASTQSRNLQYQMQVSVCQRHSLPLHYFVAMFGGTLYSYKMKGVEYWRWCMSNSHAMRFLELILPHLMLKNDRARIAIDFQKKIMAWNKDYGRRGYPDWVNAAREDFYQQMKALNKRGVSEDNPNPKPPGPRKGHGKSGFAGFLRARKIKQEEGNATVQ